MRTFAAVVAFAATANAELTDAQQLVCDTFTAANAGDTTSDLYKAACDEATLNAVVPSACDAYKAATPDDTTSDAYKAACDAASTLYMGAAMVAATAALAF